MKEQSYLRTEDLAAGYDGTAWIREISIHASRGEIVTLIGPNGAGKSTILKSIAGQLKPVGGVVSLDGREMGQWPETEIARRMAVMMTERTQPELMTCFDVAAMGRYPHTHRPFWNPVGNRPGDRAGRACHGACAGSGRPGFFPDQRWTETADPACPGHLPAAADHSSG